MYIPKRYGESKRQLCPFCNKPSTTENDQGVPVCRDHKGLYLELKCVCGEWLDIRKGKWGPYCQCPRCGNVSFAKAMSVNDVKPIQEDAKTSSGTQTKAKRHYNVVSETKTETVITSDELDLM